MLGCGASSDHRLSWEGVLLEEACLSPAFPALEAPNTHLKVALLAWACLCMCVYVTEGVGV